MKKNKEVCPHWGEGSCFARFEPGELTADGKKTHRTRCQAGLIGGCGGARVPNLSVHVPGNVKRPQVYDEFGIMRQRWVMDINE